MTARYLLKAPDEDMERWRQMAADRGVSFATHVREALDAATGKTGSQVVQGPVEVTAITGQGVRVESGQFGGAVRSLSKEQQAGGKYDRE